MDFLAIAAERLSPPEVERFLSRIDRRGPAECWPWTGAVTGRGYGSWSCRADTFAAHRLAYHVLTGAPCPTGLTLDHLCRNRTCVNPAHLEPVTNRENIHRGKAATKPTHCPRGHAYADENTVRNGGGATTRCRTCHNDKRRAKRIAAGKTPRALRSPRATQEAGR